MNLFGPLSRAIALAGVLSAGALPALAAQSDIDALAKYIGTCNGKGSFRAPRGSP